MRVAVLSATTAFSVTDEVVGTGQNTPPANPVRPRPNPQMSITHIPEMMGILVEIPEGSFDTQVSIQSLTCEESITVDASGSLFIPLCGSSSTNMVTIKQNGQTVMAALITQ